MYHLFSLHTRKFTRIVLTSVKEMRILTMIVITCYHVSLLKKNYIFYRLSLWMDSRRPSFSTQVSKSSLELRFFVWLVFLFFFVLFAVIDYTKKEYMFRNFTHVAWVNRLTVRCLIRMVTIGWASISVNTVIFITVVEICFYDFRD